MSVEQLDAHLLWLARDFFKGISEDKARNPVEILWAEAYWRSCDRALWQVGEPTILNWPKGTKKAKR